MLPIFRRYKLVPFLNMTNPAVTLPRLINVEDLGSSDGLANWLKERLPALQLDLWGSASGTKRIENLWNELLEGEISIQDAIPPKRTVHVACVYVKNEKGETLVEASQEMEDGSVRQRNRPLSEKMRPGESVPDACLRGILEELGCDRERVVIVQDSYKKAEETRESLSYPGLMTHYVIHSMVAEVHDLPFTEFSTEENECHHDTVDGSAFGGQPRADCARVSRNVKKHVWQWI